MSTVMAFTWDELITKIKRDYSEATTISYEGSKTIDYVEIPTGYNFGYPGIKTGQNVSAIDFNGLKIGTIRTTPIETTQLNHNIVLSEGKDFYIGIGHKDSIGPAIVNLEIENITLSNPRDCLFDVKYFARCYFNNITTLENESNDAYYLRFRDKYPNEYYFSKPFVTYGTNENSIFSVTTKNAPFSFSGSYKNCELYINIDKIEDANKYNTADFTLFHRIGQTFNHCYIGGKIVKDNEEDDITIKFGEGVYDATDTFFAFDSEIKIDVDSKLFENSTSAFWVWNAGKQKQKPQDNVPTDQLITLGDLRNPDILQEKDIDFVTDDAWRQAKFSTTPFEGDWAFRLNPAVNGGVIFLPFYKYPYKEIPPSGGEAEECNLCIYDMHTQQDEFAKSNGLGVLHPTSCRVTEELNGGWRVTLEHPKDDEGKWKNIREFNILKVLGQLYIIRRVIIRKNSVYASAEHISYHLNDYWLFPPFSIAGYKGQTLIDSILSQMQDLWDKETKYNFSITTNIDSVETFRDWYEIRDGRTPYEMILGSNGFISRLEGELYRDNFKMSIMKRMEKAEDNAFIIHPDLNLTSIEKTVDLETFCTYFRAYDNFGGWWAVAWNPEGLERQYPHNVVRSQNFTYDEDYYSFDMLERDGMAYFKQNCCPLISYKIAVKDLKRHKDYKQFINNFRFKVGDIGFIWDSDSKKWMELEITKTIKDGITGDCLELTIGDTRSFTRPAGYCSTFERNYADKVSVDENSGDAEAQQERREDFGTITDLYTDYIVDDYGNIVRYIGTTKSVKMPEIEGNTITLNAFDFTNITELNISEGVEIIE